MRHSTSSRQHTRRLRCFEKVSNDETQEQPIKLAVKVVYERSGQRREPWTVNGFFCVHAKSPESLNLIWGGGARKGVGQGVGGFFTDESAREHCGSSLMRLVPTWGKWLCRTKKVRDACQDHVGFLDRGVGFIHSNRAMRCHQQEMEYADNFETFGVAHQWHSHQGTRGMTFQLFPALIVT